MVYHMVYPLYHMVYPLYIVDDIPMITPIIPRQSQGEILQLGP